MLNDDIIVAVHGADFIGASLGFVSNGVLDIAGPTLLTFYPAPVGRGLSGTRVLRKFDQPSYVRFGRIHFCSPVPTTELVVVV